MTDTIGLTTAVVGLAVLVLLLALAWYLSYSAARLDRLHAKAEGALGVLDAHCVRRGEAALELANSGLLDPASALLVAGAASEALERQTTQATEDLLDGNDFAGMEQVETDLTEALAVALDDATVERILADPLGESALGRVEAAALRVQLARKFYNEAVREVTRVRGKWIVRSLRLAGHATLPRPVEFEDTLPGTLGA